MSKLGFQLFFTFFKIGAFTFGGGWAMISIMEKEIVTTHKWLKYEEFLDLVAISQTMPGILAVNMSVIIGDRLKGLSGSILAALGTILPSFVLILLFAMFLSPEVIKNNEVLNHIFKGIRPAIVALIIAPVISSAKSAKINRKTIIIPIIVAVVISLGIPFISNPILFILLGGIGGYIAYVNKLNSKIKEAENND